MKAVPDPRTVIREVGRLDAPAVATDNAAERRWDPRDRGPHRA